ncbi:MAG: peptide deformylase [Candidatus Omnitrophica bacterium]|nr:peptide deformylase [Candidatus Omnitrophota bacterium]MDD5653621.1 peptide deformylase [Candidatus Omnitrophota bacterium]
MKKTELKIRVCGDPVLSEVAKPVLKITEKHRETLSAMSRLMYEVSGVGLAAVQIGIAESFFVADIGAGLYKLINPKIIKQEGTQVMEEGCLSVPGVSVEVKRAKKITLEALDENGKPVLIEAEDLLARVFQHEIDHLNGTLILDHVPVAERQKLKKKMENFKEIG